MYQDCALQVTVDAQSEAEASKADLKKSAKDPALFLLPSMPDSVAVRMCGCISERVVYTYTPLSLNVRTVCMRDGVY